MIPYLSPETIAAIGSLYEALVLWCAHTIRTPSEKTVGPQLAWNFGKDYFEDPASSGERKTAG